MTKSTYQPAFRWLNDQGEEVPDPQPIALPLGFKAPESLQDQIRRLVAHELSDQAAAQGEESFEESEDFDIDDDMFDPSSPYEEVFDPVLQRGITLEEFRANEAVYRQRYLEAEEAAYRQFERSEALRAIPKRGAGVSPAPSSEGPKETKGNEPEKE